VLLPMSARSQRSKYLPLIQMFARAVAVAEEDLATTRTLQVLIARVSTIAFEVPLPWRTPVPSSASARRSRSRGER
jgi:hypothetical protein